MTSEDGVSWARATWGHILSVSHLLNIHTEESKEPQLAASEKDVQLFEHERLGLRRETRCVLKNDAKAVAYIANSHMLIRCSAHVHLVGTELQIQINPIAQEGNIIYVFMYLAHHFWEQTALEVEDGRWPLACIPKNIPL